MKRVILLCLCLSWFSASARAADVVIFAAASLKTALDQISDAYGSKTGLNTVISYAGSSALARQVSQGAPADLVITANAEWMDWLAEQGSIAPESRFDLLGNTLVLIQHGAHAEIPQLSATTLVETLGGNRIAMALVNAVPAGIYGKSALETLGAWTDVKTQVVQTDNARAALALVARGAAPFGIVYATDALADPRVSVIARFPSHTHPRILYPAARTTGTAPAHTAPLMAYLRSDAARATFLEHGFLIMDASQ